MTSPRSVPLRLAAFVVLALLSGAGRAQEVTPIHEVRVRLGDEAALGQALGVIADGSKPARERIELIRAAGDVDLGQLKATLLGLVQSEPDAGVVTAALLVLQRINDPALGQAVARRLHDLPAAARSTAISFLASRANWSGQLLDAVDAGRLAKRDVAATTVEVLLGHGDKVADRTKAAWPSANQPAGNGTAAEIARVRSVVEGRTGSPYRGRDLYLQRCAACHKLFHKGGDIGPNLTAYQRTDLDTLLPAILDPSREIREGYDHMQVQTKDGRRLSGFLSDRTNRLLILRGIDGSDTVVEQAQLESTHISPRSLMPEGLLTGLTDQQLRDFFAYLRIAQPIRN